MIKKSTLVKCCVATIFFTAKLGAQTFPVYLSFNGYCGNYYIDGRMEIPFYPPKNNRDTLLQLKPGQHYVGPEKEDYIAFTIESNGGVVGISNNTAAYVKDTFINGKRIPRIVFNTATVVIDPCGAPFCFSIFKNPYPNYQMSGKEETYKLIKGFSYLIAADFSGFKIQDSETGDFNIPNYFSFIVDITGNVQPDKRTPATAIAAFYKKNTVKLRTVKTKLDPKEFDTNEMKLPWGNYFKTPQTVMLIRGLGVFLRYKNGEKAKLYHIIPM